MKQKVFLDADVILDLILGRQPHQVFSSEVISLCEANVIEGFASSLTLANIYFILKKNASHNFAIKTLSKIRSIIQILPLTVKEIDEAINADFKDFEDGLQYFIAFNHHIPAIITRKNLLSWKNYINEKMLTRIERIFSGSHPESGLIPVEIRLKGLRLICDSRSWIDHNLWQENPSNPNAVRVWRECIQNNLPALEDFFPEDYYLEEDLPDDKT